MIDRIPHITSIEHRIRYEEDDHTHVAVTIGAIWLFAVALAAVWLAGG